MFEAASLGIPQANSLLMRPEPVLLLFIPGSIRNLPLNFRPPLLAALRLSEPRANLRIRYSGPEVHACHYRLLGDWARPAAAAG